MRRFLKHFVVFILILAVGFLAKNYYQFAKAQVVNISGQVNAICGNNIIEGGEQCDGSNLNNKTCSTQGFSGGTLSCNSNCTFNTSQCTSAPPPPPPSGGGGGGGGGGYFNVGTSIIFSGYAYPESQITLLKDAQLLAQSVAGDDASFKINLSGFSTGDYTFVLYATDKYGNRSTLKTFSIYLTGGAATEVSGIFFPPTITTDKTTVKQGNPISFFGQTAPFSEVKILISSSGDFSATTTANKNGEYLKEFDSTSLDYGAHTAYDRAFIQNIATDISSIVAFNVGNEDIKNNPMESKADLNGDGKVNIVDFSIMAYWFGKKSPPSYVDIGNFGVVDLRDFSILAYYWTG